MKYTLLIALLAVAITAQAQSKTQAQKDKDSAVKYYRLFFRAPFDSALPVAESYDTYRTKCLTRCKTGADSLRFMQDMIDSLAPKKKRRKG